MQDNKDIQLEQSSNFNDVVPNWLLGLYENYDGVNGLCAIENHSEMVTKAEEVLEIVRNDFTGYTPDCSPEALVDCYDLNSILSKRNSA